MSIQKTHDLPIGRSVKQFTYDSSPTEKTRAARTRAVDQGQHEPRKFDWFLFVLYVVVAIGIAGIAALLLMFLTPSQPVPVP